MAFIISSTHTQCKGFRNHTENKICLYDSNYWDQKYNVFFFLFVFVCFFVFFVTYYICAEGLECTKNISNLLTHLLHIFKPLLASNSPNKPSARSFVASVSTAQEIHASVASPSIWLSALKALHHRTLEQCSCVLLGTKASLAVWWMSLVLVIARRAACANSYILWKTDNNLGPCFLGLEYNMNPV